MFIALGRPKEVTSIYHEATFTWGAILTFMEEMTLEFEEWKLYLINWIFQANELKG